MIKIGVSEGFSHTLDENQEIEALTHLLQYPFLKSDELGSPLGKYNGAMRVMVIDRCSRFMSLAVNGTAMKACMIKILKITNKTNEKALLLLIRCSNLKTEYPVFI